MNKIMNELINSDILCNCGKKAIKSIQTDKKNNKWESFCNECYDKNMAGTQ